MGEVTVTTTTKAKRQPATVKIYCKVRDDFTGSVVDADGAVIWEQDDGYVPCFMPGDHYGDYVILDIDVATGRVLNWRSPDDFSRRLQDDLDAEVEAERAR